MLIYQNDRAYPRIEKKKKSNSNNRVINQKRIQFEEFSISLKMLDLREGSLNVHKQKEEGEGEQLASIRSLHA